MEQYTNYRDVAKHLFSRQDISARETDEKLTNEKFNDLEIDTHKFETGCYSK